MSAPALLIRHARLAGGRPADRERLASALERVSTAAIGLSPRSTLVVNRLHAAAPLVRDRAPDAFVHQLEESLRQRAANARHGRPDAGGSEDWLFEDEEALECALVGAWLEGGASPRMLLRVVTGSASPDLRTRWRRAILPDALKIARVVTRLAETELAGAWLSGFTPSELLAVAVHIRLAFGGPSEPAIVARTASGETPASLTEPASQEVQRIARTLLALAPEAESPALAHAVRVVLLTAITALRRPALMSVPCFAQAVDEAARSSRQSAVTNLVNALVPDQTAAQTELPHVVEAADMRSTPATRRHDDAIHGAHEPPPVPVIPVSPEAAACPGNDLMPASRTAFGGLLFLLNAFTAIGLYSDFARPGDAPKGLAAEELVLLLGRQWYEQTFIADPLHGVLRSIAGLRAGERAGGHFSAPAWFVPNAWLAPWPEAHAGRRRGCAWHPAGFALDDPGAAQRTRSAQRRHWVAALGRYLSARLAVALGESDTTAARDRACCHAAAIIRTSEGLTLRFGLQDHPIAIRFAGLDRDPGRLAGTAQPVRFEFAT